MTAPPAYNLLTQPILQTAPGGAVTLPGLLAALARDDIESFPALRPHQAPGWHMFLVQLAALALHRAEASDIPIDEAEWTRALRGLTPGYEGDQPWCLIVEDWAQPAFLQPPVPDGVPLGNSLATPDSLDLLITARNHDLKQAVARDGAAEDWVFALVSLQTGEGFGGAGNQGIARMNGGSSSRAMLSLAPLPPATAKVMSPRPGAWFRRDVAVLLETREAELERYQHLDYRPTGGLGLIWLAPWPEGEQLQIKDLDIWFIEVCRRIRLAAGPDGLIGWRGNSKATRINAKHLNGAVGDPFTFVHKTENKSLTLGLDGNGFDYRMLTDRFLGGDWAPSLLSQPASFEGPNESLALVCAALARGNSKTEGFKSRILPIGGKILRALTLGPKRKTLHQLALAQITAIASFDKAMRYALALAAAGGDRDKIKKEHYVYAAEASAQFERAADDLFFDHLWARYDAQERGADALKQEEVRFAQALFSPAERLFRSALPTIPCAGIYRLRAQARATDAFLGRVHHAYPELFERQQHTEAGNAT